jgi:hypothetical protein
LILRNPSKPWPQKTFEYGVYPSSSNPNAVVWQNPPTVPASAADVEASLLADLLAGQEAAAKASVEAIKWAADEVVKAIQGLPSLLPSDVVRAISDAIKEALPDSVFEDVEAASDPDTYVANQESTEISKSDIAEAVKDALEDWSNSDEFDADPEADPDPPDKKSLTAVLESYWASIQSVAVLDVLNSVSISTSGPSSLFCIGVPDGFGDEQCVDFSQWQSSFALAGNCLFSLNCICWLIYLFRSN